MSDASLSALLDALADRIAVRVRFAPERRTYSSRSLPPRCSRRRFAEVCRSGRVKDARRDGRDWVCSACAWDAARTHGAPPGANRPDGGNLAGRADALLSAAGLRVVGGRR